MSKTKFKFRINKCTRQNWIARYFCPLPPETLQSIITLKSVQNLYLPTIIATATHTRISTRKGIAAIADRVTAMIRTLLVSQLVFVLNHQTMQCIFSQRVRLGIFYHHNHLQGFAHTCNVGYFLYMLNISTLYLVHTLSFYRHYFHWSGRHFQVNCTYSEHMVDVYYTCISSSHWHNPETWALFVHKLNSQSWFLQPCCVGTCRFRRRVSHHTHRPLYFRPSCTGKYPCRFFHM